MWHTTSTLNRLKWHVNLSQSTSLVRQVKTKKPLQMSGLYLLLYLSLSCETLQCPVYDLKKINFKKEIWGWIWCGTGLGLLGHSGHSCLKYYRLFFSEASQRSGIPNPWIWLANYARSSGPDFPIRTLRTDRSEFVRIEAILAAFL